MTRRPTTTPILTPPQRSRSSRILNAIFGWKQLLRVIDVAFALGATMTLFMLMLGYMRDDTGTLQPTGVAVIAALCFWYAAARLLHGRYGRGRRDATRDPAVRIVLWLLIISGLGSSIWYAAFVASTTAL